MGQFQGAGACQQAVMVLAIGRAVIALKKGDAEQQTEHEAEDDMEKHPDDAKCSSIPWFAAFLGEPQGLLRLCGMQCLSHMAQVLGFESAMEPYVSEVVAMLGHPSEGLLGHRAEDDFDGMEYGLLVRVAAGKLLEKVGSLVVPHTCK